MFKSIAWALKMYHIKNKKIAIDCQILPTITKLTRIIFTHNFGFLFYNWKRTVCAAVLQRANSSALVIFLRYFQNITSHRQRFLKFLMILTKTPLDSQNIGFDNLPWFCNQILWNAWFSCDFFRRFWKSFWILPQELKIFCKFFEILKISGRRIVPQSKCFKLQLLEKWRINPGVVMNITFFTNV